MTFLLDTDQVNNSIGRPHFTAESLWSVHGDCTRRVTYRATEDCQTVMAAQTNHTGASKNHFSSVYVHLANHQPALDTQNVTALTLANRRFFFNLLWNFQLPNVKKLDKLDWHFWRLRFFEPADRHETLFLCARRGQHNGNILFYFLPDNSGLTWFTYQD